MSWQQRRFHGRHEFGRFPRISTDDPQPPADLKAYVAWALDKPGALAVRRPHTNDGHLVCPNTGLAFAHYGAYRGHVKNEVSLGKLEFSRFEALDGK